MERNVPCQWNLAIYKGKAPVSAGKWQSNVQTDLQCKTALHCHIPSGPVSYLQQLGIEDLDVILKERRLCWYGHVECSNDAVKTAFDIQVLGKLGPGGPKMTWKQLTERDCREWKLSAIYPHDRDTWRSGV